MALRRKRVPDKYSKGFLAELDGRTALAEELRARYSVACQDLGGEDTLSYLQRGLLERFLWLEYWIGQSEAAMARGDDVELSKHAAALNSYQGLAVKLGLGRRTPELSLSDFIKAKQTA